MLKDISGLDKASTCFISAKTQKARGAGEKEEAVDPASVCVKAVSRVLCPSQEDVSITHSRVKREKKQKTKGERVDD